MRCRMFVRVSVGCVLVAAWATIAVAAVKLPAVFSDNMVLQRGQPVPVWGWADKGEEVIVAIAGQSLATKADDKGCWKVVLDKLDVGEPLELTVQGSSGSTVLLKNVLVGEVWVGSGQSNMQMGVAGCNQAPQEIAAANYPKIRLLTVPAKGTQEPQHDFQGQWVECSSQTVGGFSAAAYFFGRKLHQELKVPIGLIHCSWGASACEAWVKRPCWNPTRNTSKCSPTGTTGRQLTECKKMPGRNSLKRGRKRLPRPKRPANNRRSLPNTRKIRPPTSSVRPTATTACCCR